MDPLKPTPSKFATVADYREAMQRWESSQRKHRLVTITLADGQSRTRKMHLTEGLIWSLLGLPARSPVVASVSITAPQE